MQNRINKNAIYNVIKSISGILFPLITFPYISRVLMADNVGKINFGNSVVSYFSLIASLGVTTYAVRECSKVKNKKEELESTASQILSINILSTIIAYVALGVTFVFARSLDNYRTLICIQSIGILFTTLGADWLNTAMEDFKFITIRTVVMQGLSLLLMFIFVRDPDDYIVYAIISIIASSGANIVNVLYRRKYCKTRLTVKLNLKRHLPPIMLLFSMILAQTVYVNSDMTMLGLIRGDFEVGLYSTSVKIYNIVNTVVASVAWVVMPQLSVVFANKDYKEVNRLLKYSLNFILVLGLPCLVGLNVICKDIILCLAGDEYVGAALSLHILTISLLFSFISGWIGNMMMLPAGREGICLRSSIVSAVVNIILNLILIPQYGLNGAAFTTSLSQLVGIFMKLPYIDKNIRIYQFSDMIKAPLIGCLAILGIGLVITGIVSQPLLVVIISVVSSAIAYILILIFMKNEFALSFIKPFLNKSTR